MISRNHSNRRAHNWLIYDINDKFLQKSLPYYKGVLYDFGCGESTYRDFLLKHAEQYVGVDWAGSLHDTKADIAADLNKPLPIETGVADTVLSLSVMEHLCEPQMMINEAYRILKPGGVMVLQVPWQWRIHEAPFDFFRYTPYGIKYLFEKAGFLNVVVEPQSGFFTAWILKLNYFGLRFAQGPRLIRWPIKACLMPFWYIGQLLAPALDKLDRDWNAEASGYFVTAKKSSIR